MGRSSLLLVLGFNIVFMIVGFRISGTANRAYEKYITYNDMEQGGLAMESAANIALSNQCMDPSNFVPAVSVPFQRGSFLITRDTAITAAGLPGQRITITGTYAGANYTTIIRVQDGSFSQYAMYTETEQISGQPIYWISGDTCRGPYHTQDYVYVSGSPVFKGMVTTLKGVKKKSVTDNPHFDGGYKDKVSVTLPSDLTELKGLGTGGGTQSLYKGVDTYVQFLPDGRVTVRTAAPGTDPALAWNYSSSATNLLSNPPVPICSTYASVSALTTTGVLLVDGSALHVKGVLNGKITLGAVNAGSRVFLDSSVVYNTPPMLPTGEVNPVCADMLGIVTDNEIRVSEGAENNGAQPMGMTIHASMFSRTAGFGALNYTTRPVGGTLTIVGGVQQKARYPVGTFSGGSITHGFQKNYYYDARLLYQMPQGYPRILFQVQDWADRVIIPDSFWDD